MFSLLHIGRDLKKIEKNRPADILMGSEACVDILCGNSVGHLCESVSGLFSVPLIFCPFQTLLIA